MLLHANNLSVFFSLSFLLALVLWLCIFVKRDVLVMPSRKASNSLIFFFIVFPVKQGNETVAIVLALAANFSARMGDGGLAS
uniref:Uncharacterized protein n=1 Tax=Rhizophora mucronata TaxID=61149 RepID=A0A2P2MQX9_RHIMU